MNYSVHKLSNFLRICADPSIIIIIIVSISVQGKEHKLWSSNAELLSCRNEWMMYSTPPQKLLNATASNPQWQQPTCTRTKLSPCSLTSKSCEKFSMLASPIFLTKNAEWCHEFSEESQISLHHLLSETKRKNIKKLMVSFKSNRKEYLGLPFKSTETCFRSYHEVWFFHFLYHPSHS